MAERIVMLGPVRDGKVQAVALTPSDAGAFLSSSNWRVTTLYSGPLANATVLVRTRPWEARTAVERRAEALVWSTTLSLVPRSERFQLDVPIPLAEAS